MTLKPSTETEIKESAQKSKEKEQDHRLFIQAVKEVLQMTDEEKVKLIREGRSF